MVALSVSLLVESRELERPGQATREAQSKTLAFPPLISSSHPKIRTERAPGPGESNMQAGNGFNQIEIFSSRWALPQSSSNLTLKANTGTHAKRGRV